MVGLLITIGWSYSFVDGVIGDSVANSLLGTDAKETAITGSSMAAFFAFVSGLAGTFTACNIACFSAVAPMMGDKSRGGRFLATLKPMGWLALGACVVAGTYGAIAALIGPGIPQLSEAVVGNGFPVRLIQSSLVFGALGLVFVYLGLAAVNVVPDPLRRVSQRYPNARLLFLGGLIGAFLIGRPFALFHKMFEYAATTNNAFIGASTFVLQTLGNILIMGLLFMLLTYGTRGRFQNWLQATPGRLQRFTASAMVIAGTFTFVYWMVRVPALFGYGWWPNGGVELIAF